MKSNTSSSRAGSSFYQEEGIDYGMPWNVRLDYSFRYDKINPFVDSRITQTLRFSGKLDFSQNLHEQLLSGTVNEEDLYHLGHETARSVTECEIEVPTDLCWYDLACERMKFLRQFIDWLPDKFKDEVIRSQCLEALDFHLLEYKKEYQDIKGDQLSVSLDNHDENVFLRGGKVQLIDLLPPMSCWWYAVPHSNLSNIMVNVEAMHSVGAAEQVKRGYLEYHSLTELPAKSFAFTRAFSYLISIAHFGSLPEKEAVAEKYLLKCEEIPSWF